MKKRESKYYWRVLFSFLNGQQSTPLKIALFWHINKTVNTAPDSHYRDECVELEEIYLKVEQLYPNSTRNGQNYSINYERAPNLLKIYWPLPPALIGSIIQSDSFKNYINQLLEDINIAIRDKETKITKTGDKKRQIKRTTPDIQEKEFSSLAELYAHWRLKNSKDYPKEQQLTEKLTKFFQ